MIIVYGIPNCDTVKKTTVWLKDQGIAYEFHDYKKSGITASKLKHWCRQAGWEIILNKKSSTWREAGLEEQSKVTSEKTAIEFLQTHTSAIKRPVIEKEGKLIAVGFDANSYREKFL